MTATLTEATPITWSHGTVTVALSVERIAGRLLHRVQTCDAGGVLDAWSASYAEEHLAREAAARVALAFRTHGSAAAIERRRNALAIALQREVRRPVRMQSRDRIATLEAELDAIADLWTEHAALAAA
jgi:hypothetical protein